MILYAQFLSALLFSIISMESNAVLGEPGFSSVEILEDQVVHFDPSPGFGNANLADEAEKAKGQEIERDSEEEKQTADSDQKSKKDGNAKKSKKKLIKASDRPKKTQKASDNDAVHEKSKSSTKDHERVDPDEKKQDSKASKPNKGSKKGKSGKSSKADDNTKRQGRKSKKTKNIKSKNTDGGSENISKKDERDEVKKSENKSRNMAEKSKKDDVEKTSDVSESGKSKTDERDEAVKAGGDSNGRKSKENKKDDGEDEGKQQGKKSKKDGSSDTTKNHEKPKHKKKPKSKKGKSDESKRDKSKKTNEKPESDGVIKDDGKIKEKPVSDGEEGGSQKETEKPFNDAENLPTVDEELKRQERSVQSNSVKKSKKKSRKDVFIFGCEEAKRGILEGFDGTGGVALIFSQIAKAPIKVYCDIVTLGGNWTVFQRRVDGKLDFDRGYTAYQDGFGKVGSGEYWLGLDKMLNLMGEARHELRVEMTDVSGKKMIANFGRFRLLDKSKGYMLKVGDFDGKRVGNVLKSSDGQKFSTFNHDETASKCGSKIDSGFWFNKCTQSSPNGKYFVSKAKTKNPAGVYWKPVPEKFGPLTSIEMKFRKAY